MMEMSRWFKVAVTVFVLFVHLTELTEQKALDDYILDYQEVDYNPFDLHENHMRVKRSLDSHLYLRFKAYNKDFHLKLKKAENIFSENHMTVNNEGILEPVDTSFIYEGSLVDDPMSSAHIAIINGTARGHIHVPGDTTYHIEPSARFFHKPGFHSVIYPEKHMNLDPYRHLRDSNVGQCGNDHVRDWMSSVSQSAYETPNRAKRWETWSESRGSFKYSEPANRAKRSTSPIHPVKNTCFLYLRSDPTLWKYIKQQKYKQSSSDQDLSDERTKEEIQAFFASHVNAIKNIYSGTRFETYDKTTQYEGITFLVQRTKIMNFESEKCGTTRETPFCKANIDVSNFLNLNSMDNHDDFCLAFLFSYRDFTHGTLGLAWVGSANRAAGGICEKFKMYPQGDKQVGKSLNTGIVSILNYGKSVPPRVSQLTFSHECGHNFGSPHDTGMHCAPYGTSDPGSKDGNYLMFASATMGDKKHNDMFSSCSKDNITRVLKAVFDGVNGKVNCFGESQGAFCGNGIREDDEECDCGYADDCKDNCCYPKNDAKECQLKTKTDGKKVQCSPTQGPCCDNYCVFVPMSKKQSCRPEDDCSEEQLCIGNNATCPISPPKLNNTLCNSNSQVCSAGKCAGSVCDSIQWSECFLTSKGDKSGPTKEELCYVSCLNPKTNNCVSSFNMDDVKKAENIKFKELLEKVSPGSTELTGILLPAGSPCDNFRGYCDVFHLCRGVDADGPLARLKNLIFNPQTLQTIKEWIVVHWWAVMLMGIGLVVVMGVFIKVCAVHTPSSNPRKPAARKLSLPGRHRHHPDQGKPQARATASGYGEPPPPYSGPSVGGPAHGKGPRYNHKGGKDRRHEMEMQQRI